MPAHTVSSIATPDFGGLTVRVGDLNCDGAPELLITQSDYGSRDIRCLTAMTIEGRRLWQTGVPSADNGRVYSDLPVQIYDWDNDGVNEVLYIRQSHYADPCERVAGNDRIRERANCYEGTALMVVLDGVTGCENATVPLPSPADDCIMFADLIGRGRREDFVVKDRYWNMWGVSRDGDVLWHWQGSTGHYPAVGDIDADGRDEVFVGYALIGHDGRALFDHHEQYGIDRTNPDTHSDANTVVRLSDGSWRLIFGNHGVHCLAPDGRELWHHEMDEAQHVVAGEFSQETARQVAVVNRGRPRNEKGNSDLYLLDLDTGRQLWKRTQPVGAWAASCQDVRWTGNGRLSDILVAGRGPGRPAVIYNGKGEIVEELEIPQAYCATYDSADGLNMGVHYCYRADVFGDSRDEVIVVGWKGVRVYANSRPTATPTLYNTTLYRGM